MTQTPQTTIATRLDQARHVASLETAIQDASDALEGAYTVRCAASAAVILRTPCPDGADGRAARLADAEATEAAVRAALDEPLRSATRRLSLLTGVSL
jgi:triosephosphate isomerase